YSAPAEPLSGTVRARRHCRRSSRSTRRRRSSSALERLPHGRDLRRVLNDVEHRIDQQRHRVDGTQSDQLLVLRLEREGVEHSVKIPRMHGIELRMQNELSEALGREPGLLDQPLDRVGPRMVRLELEVAED